MQASDLARLPQPLADHVIAYSEAKQQVAELRLPKGTGPHAVVIVIHGGCWQTPWAMDDVRSLAAALTAEGLVTCSLEYRRVGDRALPGTCRRGAALTTCAAWPCARLLSRVIALGPPPGACALARGESTCRRIEPVDGPWAAAGIVSLAASPTARGGGSERLRRRGAQLLGGAPAQHDDRAPSSTSSSCPWAYRSASSAARSTGWCRTSCPAATKRPRAGPATP
jgi:hypothetical protein